MCAPKGKVRFRHLQTQTAPGDPDVVVIEFAHRLEATAPIGAVDRSRPAGVVAVTEDARDGTGKAQEATLAVGAIVSLRADSGRSGPIIAELEGVGGKRRFRVYHSATIIRDYFEDQLQRSGPVVVDEWADRLVAGQLADPLEFRARLTATRLDNPQIDHIYALMSARIQFIPFQFKPLLRFLRADRPRLLIADDVGVGKTIEAGLILKELSTRQRLDRVLVLCPKALTVKWRAEMRRFDEEFRILSAEALRYCLDEVDLEGEWPQEYARAIVHYELFRMEQYLVGRNDRRRRHRGLLEIEPPPRFNLVIADEAHHLRTPGTGSHQLIEHLCRSGEAVLMLSATPVQVHPDNLFTLLHLLRPDLFPDRSVFRQILEPNRYLTAAVRILRGGAAGGENWVADAAAAVDQAAQTGWGRAVLQADPRYQHVAHRLGADVLDDEQRVGVIRDLEELHSLAHVMNRTRRRDIGRFTTREPRTVAVSFTAGQRRFYDAVLAFRREVLLQDYDPRVVRLILDTLERQAASCINALAGIVGKILRDGGIAAGQFTDDPDVEESLAELSTEVLGAARDLLAASEGLTDEDPKLDRLLEVVSQTVGDTRGPGKALVFSFFLNTIDYLQSRLSAAGLRVGVVTGRIGDEAREELRERFRLDRHEAAAVDVLLSSEVGCEGLDYEFCDTLVNYDIPWNPMRIEQRIGRIDRFGQTADKVVIFNFITPDTVEERVFFRCFDRLGVFRDTVGDLEEVLGEVAQDLNRIALDPSLSPTQIEEQARQVADNAIRLAEEQRRVDAQSGDLLGLDDAFTAEVDDVVRAGRFIPEADVRVLVETYLQRSFIHGSLEADDGVEVLRLRIPEDGRREMARRVRGLGRGGNGSTSFVRALDSPRDLLVTFDQATAVDRRDVEFVTPVHPLARAAAAHWTQSSEPLVGAYRITTRRVPPGWYAFTCEMWETIAARPDLRLVCLAASLDDGGFCDELSRQFLSLLPGATLLTGDAVARERSSIAGYFAGLDRVSDTRRRDAITLLEASNEQLLNRRLASLDSYHESRRRRVSAELDAATEPRIVRMKTSELTRVDGDYRERRAALERARQVEILSQKVAAGLVEIVDAG